MSCRSKYCKPITPLEMIRISGFCFLLLLICHLKRLTSADKEVDPRPREHIEGVTFESLKDVFQSYPVDRGNTDQFALLIRSCGGLLGNRETHHLTSSLMRFDPVSKPCYFILQNCRFDESMRDFVYFCASNDPLRRYDFMTIMEDETHRYGRQQTGKCKSNKMESYFTHDLRYPCVCDCESTDRQKDRYFSLLDVVSDDDKVVTGVRFRKIDHVFYIQIQQGLLGPHRSIYGDAEWKNVTSVSQSDLLSSNVSRYYKQPGNNDDLLKFLKNNRVYAVTNDQKTILLDDLKAKPKEAVTGLRFQQVGNDLRLEIQVTPFNRETGQLNRRASRWTYNGINKSMRKQVILQSSHVPGRRETMYLSSSRSRFIKFQVSDFRTDLGQTTVPFIATTDVALDQPHALTGVGIFHKESGFSAGFIALKAFVQ